MKSSYLAIVAARSCFAVLSLGMFNGALACGANDSIEGVSWAIADDGDGRVYVAGTGGVYRSCDGGDSWTKPDLAQQSPLSLLVDPIDQSTIYYGTAGFGVYRSNDFGASFVAVAAGSIAGDVFSLAAAPDGAILAGAEGGVYRSTDRGDSWQLLPGSPAGAAIHGLLTDAGNSSIIYAAKYRTGVYRTTDAAATWTSSSNGSSDWYINDLDIDPGNSSILYASASRGLWQSADAGQSWRKLDSFRGSDLMFHPQNAMSVYRVSRFDGVSQSLDGGQTWVQINNGWRNSMPRLQTIHVLANGRILVGTEYDGLFRSDDNGTSWSQAGPAPQGPTTQQEASLVAKLEYLGKGSVSAGKPARYRVTVTNNGPDTSPNTTLSFSWFHQPIIGSAVGHAYTMKPSQGHCVRSLTPDPDCQLGDIPNGASISIEFDGSTQAGQLHWYEIGVWLGNDLVETIKVAEDGIGSSVTVLSSGGGGGSANLLMVVSLGFLALGRRLLRRDSCRVCRTNRGPI